MKDMLVLSRIITNRCSYIVWGGEFYGKGKGFGISFNAD